MLLIIGKQSLTRLTFLSFQTRLTVPALVCERSSYNVSYSRHRIHVILRRLVSAAKSRSGRYQCIIMDAEQRTVKSAASAPKRRSARLANKRLADWQAMRTRRSRSTHRPRRSFIASPCFSKVLLACLGKSGLGISV
jgi:hypothetical protein